MYIKHIYIPIKKSYTTNKGLSEKLIKKNLITTGWEVWRGGFLHAARKIDIYPNIYKKYSKLESIIPTHLEHLQYLSQYHHGMPDFFCHKKGYSKFVECKLGHEQLSALQKKCIKKLADIGFTTEVHKMVFECTKIREAMVNIYTNKKKIKKIQTRLKLRY